MHELADMRYFAYWYDSPLPTIYVFEVGEDGLPIGLEREEQTDHRPWNMPLYRCGCDCEFTTWDQARDHLELYKSEPSNAPA